MTEERMNPREVYKQFVIEELDRSLDYYKQTCEGLLQEVRRLRQESQHYKQALEFYADKENYKEHLISKAEYDADGNWVEPAHYEPPIIYFDKGQIARQALGGEK